MTRINSIWAWTGLSDILFVTVLSWYITNLIEVWLEIGVVLVVARMESWFDSKSDWILRVKSGRHVMCKINKSKSDCNEAKNWCGCSSENSLKNSLTTKLNTTNHVPTPIKLIVCNIIDPFLDHTDHVALWNT